MAFSPTAVSRYMKIKVIYTETNILKSKVCSDSQLAFTCCKKAACSVNK